MHMKRREKGGWRGKRRGEKEGIEEKKRRR